MLLPKSELVIVRDWYINLTPQTAHIARKERIPKLAMLPQTHFEPNVHGVLAQVSLPPLRLAAEEEVSVLARVQVLSQKGEQLDVKLELAAHLVPDLVPNASQKS